MVFLVCTIKRQIFRVYLFGTGFSNVTFDGVSVRSCVCVQGTYNIKQKVHGAKNTNQPITIMKGCSAHAYLKIKNNNNDKYKRCKRSL